MKEKSRLAVAIGAEVRRRRLEQKRSQENFAIDCGIARAYMGAIERGEKTISIDTAKRIVSGLGVTLGEFFTGIHE
jgi:transcriptional regulator with XRE-family HTH domain